MSSHPKGATADAIAKAFGCQSAAAGASTAAGAAADACSAAAALGGALQLLVDSVDVLRRGGAAARSATVDLSDREFVYVLL